MLRENVPIHDVHRIAADTFQLSFVSPSVSARVSPGQFVNVRVEDAVTPFLRRPFSISAVEHDIVSILFNVVGVGTRILSQKEKGDTLDIIGPLGEGTFPLDDPHYDTALIVAGGLGVATFPFLTSRLPASKQIRSFVGARTSAHLVTSGLRNVLVATDDGSEGYRGSVVDLLKDYLNKNEVVRPRIFSCGPTAMMRGLAKFAAGKEIACYVALEGEMGCGLGLCQGCPVEMAAGDKKYALVCKEGPVFESRKVNF